MGTEEDKPNTGVLVTLFVIGAAAMLGGSAAIVGMTRTEMAAQGDQLSAYADLESVRSLRDAQQKVLREAKLPIDRARDELLSEIQRNPRNASWATPELAASATASAATSAAGAGGAGGAAAEGAAGAAAGGAPQDGAQPDGTETAAPPVGTGAAAPEATSTAAPKAPPAPLPKGFGSAGGASAPPATSN